MSTLYENIFVVAKAKGLQQKELARLIGIRPSALSDWKKGRIKPSIEMLGEIAKHLGVSTDYLLGLTPNPTQKAESSPRERMTQEIQNILDSLPEEKLPSVKALLLSVIDVAR